MRFSDIFPPFFNELFLPVAIANDADLGKFSVSFFA